ncbi:MAG: hypothetical protein HZB91_07595 [Elusimicrobia bacterium]|nr:hypothetical protein [Elusimicrobiota bacterium]
MSLGKCPECGGADVRRSSSRVRHIIRTVLNKGHRVCACCGAKWHVKSFIHVPPVGVFNRTNIFVMAFVLLGVIAVVVITTASGVNPLRWAKQQVRTASDSEKGKGSQGFLWSLLGGLYGSKEEAKSDYREHSKD